MRPVAQSDGHASVFSPLTAAKATFALKAGVWFRRGCLLIVSPALRPSWPTSGRNSTYPTCSKIPSQLSVLHGSGSRAHRPLPRPGSGDADGLRASQLQHAVERVDADVDLGGAAPVGARVQPIPDHAFVA